MHCDECGGLKGEPGKLYSYAGKWCDCWSKQYVDKMPKDLEEKDIKKFLKELKDLNDLIEILSKDQNKENFLKLKKITKRN